MENILFTICARAGSKGVKGKNIKQLNNIPLLYYTLAAYIQFREKYAMKYGNISLAINTDSEILLEQMKESTIPYLFVSRTEELAGDVISKISVIRDTLQKAEEIAKQQYDIILDLDLTSPIRTIEDIEGTIQTILNDGDADISFSVAMSRRSPYFNMVCQKENGYYDRVISAEYVSRQQTPECFDMNASIYAYRKKYLLEKDSYQRKALIWKMKDTGILDIDSESDFELLEVILPFFIGKYQGFAEIVKIAEKIVGRFE